MSTATDKVVMDDDALRRTLVRIAHEIVEKNADLSDVCLVGIYTRGVAIAQRLRREIGQATGFEPDVGALDISFYRDDVRLAASPSSTPPGSTSRSTAAPSCWSTTCSTPGARSGPRSMRCSTTAAPPAIRLAVLADRGHRELPIRADYVGKNLPTSAGERVFVRLVEVDEVDEVAIR